VEACDQVWKAESRADVAKRDRLERNWWMWLKPGQLDGEGGPKAEANGPGTVCDRHGLRDEAGASNVTVRQAFQLPTVPFASNMPR
jgi:hypothetical protein